MTDEYIEPLTLRFFCDHNVPDSVGRFLEGTGHDLVRLRDVMAIDAKDPVVAAAAINDDRILISWDRDFNQQRFMQPRFSDLSRISMSGSEVHGAARMEEIFDIILFAFSRANGTPLTIRVGPSKIQLHV